MVFIVIIGVCGCGKTTIAQELGHQMDYPIDDADDFHTETNKRKMNQSIPLTDEDRYPWLMAIHKHIEREASKGHCGVIACSALKKAYRQILATGAIDGDSNNDLRQEVLFVYLKGSKRLIEERLARRTGHFMSASLLQSQLDILEEPDDHENCLVVNIDQSPSDIASVIVSHLAKPVST